MISRLRFELRGLWLAVALAWWHWRADAADKHARHCVTVLDGAEAWADYTATRADDAERAYQLHEGRRDA